LERVRGKIGDDGIERITTQLPFDFEGKAEIAATFHNVA
jgi:hypothetical protein